MANYTGFTILEAIPDINVTYVSEGEDIGDADIIIIPGSKSVISDYTFLKNNGWDESIYRHNSKGNIIIGICGGYQMLGNRIEDPYGVEGKIEEINGLGLFNMTTTFNKVKTTTQSHGVINIFSGELHNISGVEVEGYEIHMGISESKETKFITLGDGKSDGSIKDHIIGTYFHGILHIRITRLWILKSIKIMSLINWQNYMKSVWIWIKLKVLFNSGKECLT